MYEWDWFNARHSSQHGIRPFQAREALEDPNRVVRDQYQRRNEWRSLVVGETKRGQLLNVVYTLRPNDRIRIIAAWRASPSDRERYRRENTG